MPAILFGTDRFPFPFSNRLSRRHPRPLTRICWTSSYMQAVFYRLSPYLVFGIMVRHRRDAPLYLRLALTRIFPYMARTCAYMTRDLPHVAISECKQRWRLTKVIIESERISFPQNMLLGRKRKGERSNCGMHVQIGICWRRNSRIRQKCSRALPLQTTS